MEPTVSVETFEGPLGLLLELVEANKLEITSISVATITRQYLARIGMVKSTSHNDLAQFVELGARLLHIKSAALLPIPESGEASPQAELQRLNEELDEYRAMRDTARKLEQHLKLQGRCFERPSKAVRASAPLPLPQIEITLLTQAFQAVLRETRPAKQLLRIRHAYDQAIIAKGITRRLQRGQISLTELVRSCHDRLEIVVTFVALLELVKAGSVMVRQSQIFDDIYLELARD